MTEKKSALQFEITHKKVKPENVMHFSRQLAAFLRAGVPIVEAVEIVLEETEDKTLRKVLADVADSLRRGEPFSDALAARAEAFPPFFVSVLRAVELTGLLDVVLDQLSRYIERDLEARRKIKAACTYPAMIMALSLVVVVILAGFVLPRFKGFFLSFHAKLPLPMPTGSRLSSPRSRVPMSRPAPPVEPTSMRSSRCCSALDPARANAGSTTPATSANPGLGRDREQLLQADAPGADEQGSSRAERPLELCESRRRPDVPPALHLYGQEFRSSLDDEIDLVISVPPIGDPRG